MAAILDFWSEWFFLSSSPWCFLPSLENMSFGSGIEAKNRFWRWRPWRPSSFSDQNDFSYFDLLVTPMLPYQSFLGYQVSRQSAFSLRKHAYSNILKTLRPEKKKKKKKKKKGKFSDKKKIWYFSYVCSKHRLCVLVRTASPRRF